jgi:hypothetical protein
MDRNMDQKPDGTILGKVEQLFRKWSSRMDVNEKVANWQRFAGDGSLTRVKFGRVLFRIFSIP